MNISIDIEIPEAIHDAIGEYLAQNPGTSYNGIVKVAIANYLLLPNGSGVVETRRRLGEIWLRDAQSRATQPKLAILLGQQV